MYYLSPLFLTIFLSFTYAENVYVILSQSNKFNANLDVNLKSNIFTQYSYLNKESPKIYLSHIDLPHVGDWTIFPLIPKLINLSDNDNTSWTIFLEEYTKINVNLLLKTLSKYNSSEDLFIGHALHDESATIIHHFAFYQNPKLFKYPNSASGFAISSNLLKKLARIITQNNVLFPDFSIDKSHEFALFINKNVPNCVLQHEETFCIKNDINCATFSNFNLCKYSLPENNIFFAVKTCKKFHDDRIPVVKNTWGKTTENLKFFSDISDPGIPTISLGIPNTEQGHCDKTMGILKYLQKEIEKGSNNASWFVIADDDTILNVKSLSRLLSCYDPIEDVALGERYGYQVIKTPSTGFNYITGGGGMVFSRPLIKAIVSKCRCPTPHSPDDMYLGACLQGMGVEVLHSPAFHQARPDDYSEDYLKSHRHVSFHKHWMTDPILIYKNLLKNEEEDLLNKINDEL